MDLRIQRNELARIAVDKLAGELCLQENSAGQSPLEASIYHNDIYLFNLMLNKVAPLFNTTTSYRDITTFAKSLRSVIRNTYLLPEESKTEFNRSLNEFIERNTSGSSIKVSDKTKITITNKYANRLQQPASVKEGEKPVDPTSIAESSKIAEIANLVLGQIGTSSFDEKENEVPLNFAKGTTNCTPPLFDTTLNSPKREKVSKISKEVIPVLDRDSPLQKALRDEDMFTAQEILKRSSEDSLLYINQKGETALFTAIEKGNIDISLQIFKICPAAMCSINAKGTDSPLTLAIEKEYFPLIDEMLLELGKNSSLRDHFESTFKGGNGRILQGGTKVLKKLRLFAERNPSSDIGKWIQVEPIAISNSVQRGRNLGYLKVTRIRKSESKNSPASWTLDDARKSQLLLKTIESMTDPRKLTPEEINQLGPKDQLPVDDTGCNALHLLILNSNTEAALQVIDYMSAQALTKTCDKMKITPLKLAQQMQCNEIIEAIQKKLQTS